eukprot:7605511-Ditylum_brightwellii.AAC.1
MAKPYPVLIPQREQTKTKLYRQVETGILKKLMPEEADATEWTFTMFFVPKKDKKSMQTMGDLGKLNELHLRSPEYTRPINKLLAFLGAWTHVPNIDFNMGYYVTKLCA